MSIHLKACRELSVRGQLRGVTLTSAIKNPGDILIFLGFYTEGRKHGQKLNRIGRQVQLGLAGAFAKFSEAELAPYAMLDVSGIKLRDALFVSHASPPTPAHAVAWKKLADNKLQSACA